MYVTLMLRSYKKYEVIKKRKDSGKKEYLMNQVNRYLIASAIFLGLLVSSSFGAGKVLLIGSGAPDAKDTPLIDKLKEW